MNKLDEQKLTNSNFGQPSTSSPKTFVLTREQISKMYEFIDLYPEVGSVVVSVDSSSGIGPSITVTASVLKKIDITDMSNW